jgi:hypothetical protein
MTLDSRLPTAAAPISEMLPMRRSSLSQPMTGIWLS